MMNEGRRKLQTVQVDHYDGQAIYTGNELLYELGGYLGGGAAGVVYEAFSTRTKQHVAMKILNPVGYKLFSSSLLARCIVAVKGKPLLLLPSDETKRGEDSGRRLPRRAYESHRMRTPRMRTERIRIENVWWLIHPTSKQAIAAVEDPNTGHVRELTLPQCIQVWGEQLDSSQCYTNGQQSESTELYQEVQVKNQKIKIPRIPKKFLKFAMTRQLIHREISNMSGLEYHENVLRLDEALELVQESKCTTFLVLELAGGGELFDRIKLDCGINEETARRYFRQLISGVAFCHNSGVCHRDLKPENLLLADNEDHSTLKIADFGLSAIFAVTENSANGNTPENGVVEPAIRRLRSVVGSPHYVAPEVLMDAGQGYDGAKADAWSIGIIVYAMIAGNLPFGKDLLKCVRYDRFRKWSYLTKYSDDEPTKNLEFPTWFFPAHFSIELKSLIAQLLYPDACTRLSVEGAQCHVWVRGEKLTKSCPVMLENDEQRRNDFDSNTPAVIPPVLYPTHRNHLSINTFQDNFERGQHMHASQFDSISPQAITSLLAKSPCSHSQAFRCPASPQQAYCVNKHLAGVVGYMPSVDETSSMSGLTPLNSPRDAKDSVNFQSKFEGNALSMASPMESIACNKPESERFLKDEALVREATMAMHIGDRRAEGASGAHVASKLIEMGRHEVFSQENQLRFVSPPIISGSRDNFPTSSRRNSPPELFSRGFGYRHVWDLTQGDVDSDCNAKDGNFSSGHTPPPCSQSGDSPDNNWSDSSNSLESLSFTIELDLETQNKVSQANRKVDRQPINSTSPPLYTDVVARSTRFLTALPARLALAQIELALKLTPCPFPYDYSKATQKVAIDWSKYQLEVRYAGLLTCTVQVFLFQRGVYLVEFRRSHFQRFYKQICAQILESLEPRPSSGFRKRNKSLSN
ncbi:hypothetical protein CCR75_007888 [Bremia lactucae]|uniref:non-specific serine/threonine protein kinase n=1 Tax=Bremia lactucae TaxID=4779 RepID=A0A976IEU4_BRELC|nr:hypothetical protein CCR75_007888 [Bremia lactucae]